MKVLMTGGVGFIGSHTAKRFLDEGHEVFALDIFRQYKQPIESWYQENIKYRWDYLLKGAEVIQCSTLSYSWLARLVEQHNFDCIIHFAALSIANLAREDSEDAYRGMIQGTHNLLEILRFNPKRLVYISSSMVYGDFQTIPVPETATTNPKSIYGSMKLAGEILVKGYAQTYDFPYTIIRPSAVYGPSDCNLRVVQKWLHAAFAREPITIVKGADTVMDFTYVTDTACGIYLAATSKSVENQIFNITRGRGWCLETLVELLRFHFEDLKVIEKEGEGWRPKRGALDISKAGHLLGYHPHWSIEDGLFKYVQWMYEHNHSVVGG